MNPRNTSKEGRKIREKLGLDRHLSSAYVIAKEHQNIYCKDIKRPTNGE